MFSNLMLSVKNDIGFSINELLLNKITIDDYYEKYCFYFGKINRKSPKGHASVQKWNTEYLMEFIRDVYKYD